MCKKLLRVAQMNSADVSRAQTWADDLVRWEAKGWGDAGNAMKRVAARAKVPFSKVWALKYRPPKEIASHVLSRLEAAHAAERERQLRKLADETALTALVAGPNHPAVRAAGALLRAAAVEPDDSGDDLVPPPLGTRARSSRRLPPPELTDLPLFRAADPRP